jgi:SAM-dependent methyltransferase
MKFALNTKINDILLSFQKIYEHSSLRRDPGFSNLEPLINKTISSKDALYPVYKKDNAEQKYFLSGLRQLASFDQLLQRYGAKRLAECQSIVDFACHYGRVLRCLRAALPSGKLYACDIDREAVEFCKKEFGCLPLYGSWNLEDMVFGDQHDFIFCISLLTHTRKEYFSKALKLWETMLQPGGLLLFTFLGEDYIDKWISGQLDHYVPTPVGKITLQSKVAEFQKFGHTFQGFTTGYSTTDDYGIGFLNRNVIENELRSYTTLKLEEVIPGFKNDFSQDLAVVLKL